MARQHTVDSALKALKPKGLRTSSSGYEISATEHLGLKSWGCIDYLRKHAKILIQVK